jgi:hypothetical protein
MSETDKTVTARRKQSEKTKTATLDRLIAKRRATTEFSIYVTGDDGPEELVLKFQAIGAREYDSLVSKHPPKAEARAEGASFNIDTFAPALIAACSLEPELTPSQAREIWESEDWSRGDLMVLFRNAVELNNRGIDIPFSENG